MPSSDSDSSIGTDLGWRRWWSRERGDETTPTESSAKEEGKDSPSSSDEGRPPSPVGMWATYFGGDEGTIGGLHAGGRDGAQEDERPREGEGLCPQQREESRAAMPSPNYGGGDSKLDGLHARQQGDGTREEGRERGPRAAQ